MSIVLQKRLIPKIEGFLVKEKFGRGESLEKNIRSLIALALVKFFEDCLAQLLSKVYQLHIRSVDLHSIVLDIFERKDGSGYLSAEDPESQIFSLCISAVIDLIQKDIFGSASNIKEV